MSEVAPTVVERIRRARNEIAPAEQRVVDTLLTDYPVAGLGSVAELVEQLADRLWVHRALLAQAKTAGASLCLVDHYRCH